MKSSDIVCDCYQVTVGEVKDYLKISENKNKPLHIKLRELKIAQGCRFCFYAEEADGGKIDIHYSKLLK